jgi:hypothetical protein
MKRLFSLILVGMLAVSGLSAKVKLSVLYVGGTANMDPMLMAPGSVDSVALAASVKERMAHFTKFLKKNFTNVKLIEGKDYTPEMSAAYDVTVFDGRTVPFRKGDRMKGERDSYLPESFDRAAVMIGHMSEDLGRSLGNKNDWYCLCLDNYALGMKNDHPVFNGPFKVDMTTEMHPTAAPALEVAEMMGESLPEEMPMLLMHSKWTEEEIASGSCRIGMVSRPGGYLDSPDTEVISGGLCGKSIDAVAIGRHGNLFHFGFAADPERLTPAGQAILLNSIVYASKFNGQKPIARKMKEGIATRDHLPMTKWACTRKANDRINEQELTFRQMIDSVHAVAVEKKAKGEELTMSEAMYLDMSQMPPVVKKSFGQYLKERNPKLYEVFGTDEAAYANYYAKMDTESHKLVYMTPETGGFLQTTHTSGNFWTARGQLNYTNTFGKHEISAIAGLEFRETKTNGDKSLVLGYDEQLQSSATHTVDFGTLSQMSNSPYFQMNGSPFPCNQFAFTPYLENGMGIVKEVRHRYGSGYFNATYTYDNKYNIFGSFRKDYADIYGLDAKFRGRPLWSVGIGWNAHNESFLRDLSWMDFLKLRFSYGVTGNIYQGATSHMTASSGDINSTTNLPVASISSPANPDLRWEQNRTTNVGLDYGFMSYRLRGSLDYYVKTGKDIFAPITLDPTTGFSSMVANVASIRNNGIELAIGYDWFVPGNRRGFSWTTNLTVTYNKNKVLEVENPATRAYDLVSLPYKTGYPVNALWAYRFAGIDDRPGLVGQSMYYVENGNTSHNASSASVDVLEFGGQSDPKAIVGMDNQLRWNGLSLGFLLVYYGGHKMFAQPKSEVFESSWDSPLNIVYLNSWTPENHSDVPGIGEYASTSLGSECRTATNCLYDADFLKIRNITIGYDLPEHLTEKVGISKISLRFQINDPKALWIKNNAGIDPETLGIRKQASYMFGVNLSL